jgi:1-acyl-sn-glycerol-3-phosphate acyltransferase
MIGIDLIEKLATPRVMRAMVDNFMGFLPFLNVFFYRVGQVVGARRNFEDLLKADEIVCVFPEGTKGIGKPYSRKYKLVRFNVGFVELAVRFRVPIIPAAVVGAEEQAPMLYNVKTIARALGFPYFPITPFFPHFGLLGALPLPVKYHIRYGEPFHFYESYPPESTDDPELMQSLAEKVQLTVQEMIDDMLAGRESVFGLASGPRRAREPRAGRRQRRME